MHGLTCLFDLSTLYNTCQGYIWHLFVVAHPIGVYPSSLSHPKLASKPLWQSCPWLRLPENDRSRLSDSLVLFTTRSAILPILSIALDASDGSDLKIFFNLVIRVFRNDVLFFRLLRLFRCRLFWLRHNHVIVVVALKYFFSMRKMTVFVFFENCYGSKMAWKVFLWLWNWKILSNWIRQAWVRFCRWDHLRRPWIWQQHTGITKIWWSTIHVRLYFKILEKNT